MKSLNNPKPRKSRLLRWVTPLQWQNLWVALFVMLVGNASFYGQITHVYPISAGNGPFVLSVLTLFWFATALFFSLICYGRAARWVLAVYLVTSALAAYFMDRYGTVIDSTMIENMVQTNVGEAGDLFSWTLLGRLVVFGVIPALLVVRFAAVPRGSIEELRSRLVFIVLLLVGVIGLLLPFTSQYASFFREHKMVRFYANPTYYTYSLVRFGSSKFKSAAEVKPEDMVNLAQDANQLVSGHRELVILVVGETARADHFSLNGYEKPTNPLLAKQNVVSFKDVTSCGTTTAVSVPCMFSPLTADDYSVSKAKRTLNALDVLKDAGVEVLWRDNNSDSKGVADRITYQDYRTPDTNTVCDEECRDVGMLVGLDEFINSHPNKDILIVLHAMGNHGPAYFKRYPKAFEKFTPICETNELSACTDEQINNTYDNAILYTDYFLDQTIEFLKKYDDTHETAMLYVSDHGESLGEMGLYLHGAPVAFAPKEQTHVAVVAWLGKLFDYSIDELRKLESRPFTHDDLFCTLLLGFEISTQECKANENLINKVHSDKLSK